MSNSSSKVYFKLSDINPASDFKLAHVQVDNDVYSSEVFKRKTFLGRFERWVVVADLMDPLRDIDNDIEAALLKVKELKAEREVRIRQQKTIMASIPLASNGGKRYSLGKASTTQPVKDFFGDGDEEKKKERKTTSVILHGAPATPEKQNNNQKRNN